MGRKIVFELTQPLYAADGELVGQPGDRISEADYDKLSDTVTPGTYRAVIVEEDDSKPKSDAKADSKPESKSSSSFSSSKGTGG
jgi:hypothetical protein